MTDDTYVRTVTAYTPELSAKKAGILNRAMKDYRRARQLVCEYFQQPDADPTEFTYSERNELQKEINNHPRITLSSRTIYPAITTVRQNYEEYAKDQRASTPTANRADILGLEAQRTRIFAADGTYYLTVHCGTDRIPIPLHTSNDTYHTDRLPYPESAPDKISSRQRISGVNFSDLGPDDFPFDTVGLGTSTLSKVGDRQYRANLSFKIKKRITRNSSADDARFVIGVDRGRNHLAYACLYDREDDHVVDWWNRSGDDVSHYMDQLAERISGIQQAGAIDDMLRLRSRRRRYKRQIDYEIANEVVRFARERLNCAIAIEDLSKMSRLGNYTVENRRFSEWSYYRLAECIADKAEPYDIPVTEVPAYNTSTECSRCGEDEETHRTDVHFECGGCGYQQNADANAAVNIAKRAK